TRPRSVLMSFRVSRELFTRAVGPAGPPDSAISALREPCLQIGDGVLDVLALPEAGGALRLDDHQRAPVALLDGAIEQLELLGARRFAELQRDAERGRFAGAHVVLA